MGKIEPQIHFADKDQLTYTVKFFKTYHKDLKPQIKQIFKDFNIHELSVYRSRRGEWGEWFEIWRVDDNFNPYIERQGFS